MTSLEKKCIMLKPWLEWLEHYAVLGNLHSMAHKSGPIFNIPHGCANAIYLPYVIQFNRTVVDDRYAAIAKRLDLKGLTNDELVDAALISYIDQINNAMEIPKTLREYGVSEEKFNEHVDDMAINAVKDPCTSTNPRETSVEEMKKLYLAAFYLAAFYGQEVNFYFQLYVSFFYIRILSEGILHQKTERTQFKWYSSLF